jgi:hypothetical protein
MTDFTTIRDAKPEPGMITEHPWTFGQRLRAAADWVAEATRCRDGDSSEVDQIRWNPAQLRQYADIADAEDAGRAKQVAQFAIDLFNANGGIRTYGSPDGRDVARTMIAEGWRKP